MRMDSFGLKRLSVRVENISSQKTHSAHARTREERDIHVVVNGFLKEGGKNSQIFSMNLSKERVSWMFYTGYGKLCRMSPSSWEKDEDFATSSGNNLLILSLVVRIHLTFGHPCFCESHKTSFIYSFSFHITWSDGYRYIQKDPHPHIEQSLYPKNREPHQRVEF